MWTNTPSIQVASDRIRAFKPPYCANPACEWHFPGKVQGLKPFKKFGARKIERFPYISQRFRCKRCLATFTSSFFTLHYRDKKSAGYADIFQRLCDGASKRSIGRTLGFHEETVRRKRKKMARAALLEWASDVNAIRIEESVAFDGLENFAYSQYDPNNLNHAVGRESLFVYDFNLSLMNRKGRTSPRQKAVKKWLDEEHGKYKGRWIEEDSGRLFARLLEKCDELTLHTDQADLAEKRPSEL